ncbi:PAS domain-containing sensor histidine kinase [Novosphingobium sp. Gsoil 351]|nr:PAS domain-containing sensor histidine kinase [Novosphingobium sp. Gsoil 351]
MVIASETSRPDALRLIASFPFAVLLIDPALAIAGTNPAAEQVLGQSTRRLLGKSVASQIEFAESHVATRLGESDAQLFARDSAVRIGSQARRLDVMLAPVAGHPGWQMLILHESIGVEALGGERHGGDGTPLRAPEVLAHEIKNPLAGIRGAAQLLARSGDPRQRELTTLITSEVDRVTKLIDQMQTLSRRGAAPQTAFNVHEALRRAVAVLSTSGTAMPRVEEEFDPSLPPVLCSPDALVQVVLNLIGNAREACAGAASPRIAIRTRFASGIRLHGVSGEPPLPLPIEVRVSDNGQGVDTELGDRIFEPFVSGKPHGQGLGLALVQKLVREMSGRITYDRDEAAGLTHFRLHLPVAERRSDNRPAAAA